MIFTNWDGVRRADGYRAKLINVTNGETVKNVLVTESEAMFKDLPTGLTLNLVVTVRKATGKSWKSYAAQAAVP